VLEATRGVGNGCSQILVVARLPAVCVNPKTGERFCQRLWVFWPRRIKLTAHVMHDLQIPVRPEIRPLKTEETEMPGMLLIPGGSQLIIMLTAEKNRLTTASKWTKKDVEKIY